MGPGLPSRPALWRVRCVDVPTHRQVEMSKCRCGSTVAHHNFGTAMCIHTDIPVCCRVGVSTCRCDGTTSCRNVSTKTGQPADTSMCSHPDTSQHRLVGVPNVRCVDTSMCCCVHTHLSRTVIVPTCGGVCVHVDSPTHRCGDVLTHILCHLSAQTSQK